MRAMLTMVTMWLALATCAPAPAHAQRAKPTPEQQAQCVPVATVKADAVITRLFSDADGDWWIVIRYASTGTLHIGLLLRNGQFCITGEGRTNRES